MSLFQIYRITILLYIPLASRVLFNLLPVLILPESLPPIYTFSLFFCDRVHTARFRLASRKFFIKSHSIIEAIPSTSCVSKWNWILAVGQPPFMYPSALSDWTSSPDLFSHSRLFRRTTLRNKILPRRCARALTLFSTLLLFSLFSVFLTIASLSFESSCPQFKNVRFKTVLE